MTTQRISTVLLAVAAVLALALPATTASADTPEVSLRWALGAREADVDAPSAIQKDTQLGAGSRLKFLVEPLSPCSVYLILLDSQENVHVLFRESARLADPTYIPPGEQWFELDNEEGMETFFLLASAKPLAELEALLDRQAAEDSAALQSEIVSEIRRLYKAHRNFSRPVEKPVMIGGRTRGDGDTFSSIDRLAVEISAEQFYGKTITIDH